MALTAFYTDVIASGDAYTITSSGTYVLTQGTRFISSLSSALAHNAGDVNNIDVIIAGEAYGGGNTIELRSNGTTSGHSVTITETGVVVADFYTGIVIEGDNSTAVNHGSITTARSTGILLQEGNQGSVFNYGSITAAGQGAYSVAIQTDTDDARIENHGTLIGTATGRGTISVFGSVSSYVLNTGTVSGTYASFFSDDTSEDLLVNTGFMSGDVLLGDGADVFRGYGGTVQGGVYGDGGDDLFMIDQADATIDGGLGTDTLYARSDVLNVTDVEEIKLLGSADFAVTSGNGAEVITGNDGNNRIEAMGGNDTVRGNAGDDAIFGFAGADVLNGGLGDDLLDGGNDSDTILGGSGDDLIYGGNGQDLLSGQLGADTYVYASASELGSGASADRILFEQGTDVVDVSAIEDAAFTFIGGAGFSASGGMEIRAITAGSGHGVAMFDVDGDGNEDARLILLSVPVITADDFVL